jgi:hypothetical protein
LRHPGQHGGKPKNHCGKASFRQLITMRTLPAIIAILETLGLSRCRSWKLLNPDFAVGFVMKGKNPIKTSAYADFLDKIAVNYAEVKKSRKCTCLQEFCPTSYSGRLAIESQLQNLG